MSDFSILQTAYGRMIVPIYDRSQTCALKETGKANDWNEIDFVSGVLRSSAKRGVFLDIGACIGTWSQAMARHECVSEIHAFEPQVGLANCIAGSCALNNLTNVTVHPEAVGVAGSCEIPQFDYGQPLNFGSVNLGKSQVEPLDQDRKPDIGKRCRIVSIDEFSELLTQPITFIKIDVEGMEELVLMGGVNRIAADKPIMFIEFIKCDKAKLAERIVGMGYDIAERFSDFQCTPKS